ncbi:putative dCMP deaminase [Filobasidium floriforme]|uniref:putative dCMP deaminase n=1 Tax=Filobasidium floriforme TaxID=5210 RepID=UPI001E8CDD18|nr:putative dCMP deaminase [Filobasidium floriforme]KAH8080857.1 putative dCMP deaminase [Filobasidium floriforme]
MFVVLVGTPGSGKDTIARYLESKHGFLRVGTEATGKAGQPSTVTTKEYPFPSRNYLLNHITQNWKSDFVTTCLTTEAELLPFIKRPSVLVVAVDGPVMARWKRKKSKATEDEPSISLEDFVSQHDDLMNSATSREPTTSEIPTTTPKNCLRALMSHAHLTIMNSFETIPDLEKHLDEINLLDPERLRPGWDGYFMTLACLASLRSNCMKRRVGAILVRSKRILSTGYNGTPRGVKNCNDGGCKRCNTASRGGEGLDGCLCLHAEENALLEAGRERIGEDSVIYCNTCPCLTCSVKIVQCGVREVVYNLSYAMEEASAKILEEGGVKLRKMEVRREVV